MLKYAQKVLLLLMIAGFVAVGMASAQDTPAPTVVENRRSGARFARRGFNPRVNDVDTRQRLRLERSNFRHAGRDPDDRSWYADCQYANREW